MAVMDEAFWAHLDAQIIANRPEGQGRPATAAIPTGTSATASTANNASAASPSRAASDWTGVLDTLTAAKSAAQQQDARLREQAAEQAALLQELKRTQQEVRALEALLREVRAQADTKMEELQTQVGARVRDLQAEAAAQLQAMEERALAAEARAEAAEDWLKRIEQASQALFPVDQRAAA
jgi:chromosome segregation ATPase